jgi:hypothetical protein
MALKKIRLAETVALLDRPPAVEGSGVEAAKFIKFWILSVLLASAVLEGAKSTKSQTPEAGRILTRKSRPTDPFEYVFEIVAYLLRYDRFPDGRDRFKIDSAKDFAWAKLGRVGSVRTVAKYWEENRLVAPYIYAMFHYRSFRATDETRPQHAINWLTMFFSQKRRVRRMFGHAAHAADVLAKIVEQREGDFIGVTRECPPARPFSVKELGLVPIPTRLESIGRALVLRPVKRPARRAVLSDVRREG